jgi:hypothetical protein
LNQAPAFSSNASRWPGGRSDYILPVTLRRSVAASKALPDLIGAFLKRVKPGMKALVVKAKYVANDDQPKKPVVAFEIFENLLNRTGNERNEAK